MGEKKDFGWKWKRKDKADLVLNVDVASGADEDPRHACVAVPAARVQRRVSILKKKQSNFYRVVYRNDKFDPRFIANTSFSSISQAATVQKNEFDIGKIWGYRVFHLDSPRFLTFPGRFGGRSLGFGTDLGNILCCLEVSIRIALFTHKNVVPVFTAQTFLSSALKGTDFCNNKLQSISLSMSQLTFEKIIARAIGNAQVNQIGTNIANIQKVIDRQSWTFTYFPLRQVTSNNLMITKTYWC